MQASASAPALPPVAAPSSTMPVPAHVRAAAKRGQREASKRKDFLGGLINQARIRLALIDGAEDFLVRFFDKGK